MHVSKLLEHLAAAVGDDHLMTSSDAMSPYLQDWRGRYRGVARCVVRPANTAEVAAVVRACAQAGAPMLAQGGNTSLCGGATPDASGETVLINLSRMNKIRQIDAANNTMTVEAGCVLADVQQAATEAGRLFPLSLAAEGSCQIGGNLSTNAGGVQVLRYGNMRELTLGLEVVLPNGDLWDGLRGLRKDNTGYDLKQLFIGAEGTLGIVTAAVLKLFPRPQASATAWLAIDSPEAAVRLLADLQAHFGPALTACELVADTALALVLAHMPDAQAPLPQGTAHPWHLLVELSGNGSNSGGNSAIDESALRESLTDLLAQALQRGALHDAVAAQSLAQAKRLWCLREQISEAQKIEGPSIKHDISLPISRIPEFIERADRALREAFPDMRIVTFGHIGDGNLHYNQSMRTADENAALLVMQSEVNRIVYAIVHELGGSISAEHGIGQLKREELLRYKSPIEIATMRAIKQAIDPQGLMNPGKVL